MTFVNMYYAEFDTTQANLLADLRTHILSSASWTRPNAGSKPDTYKATTTRGADMVFDLSDGAITTAALTIGAWKSYDGTTFVDKTSRWLYWRAAGGASTNPLHCVVSVSKEHVFISVEGPRAPEAGSETANLGSARSNFWMCDVVPYHAGDTTPTVFCGGQAYSGVQATVSLAPMGNLRTNYANTASWSPTRLLTLSFPTCGDLSTASGHNSQRLATGDGKYYLWPYVCVSDTDGLRGRLMAFFNAGVTTAALGSTDVSGPPIGSKVTYDGQLYKLLPGNGRTGQTNTNNWNQFGAVNTAQANANAIVVAVPTT